jgi:hypothetical protein
MTTAAETSEVLRRLLAHPTRGVVGLVDDLLAMCQAQHLELDWDCSRCRIRSTDGAWEELADLPMRKSVFRAILARIAVLCNERAANPVSPYGGQCDWLAGTNPPTNFRVRFTNTAAEQRLELAHIEKPLKATK